MDFSDRHVVVTGGTGALGTAVVGALVEAGAICHVPYVDGGGSRAFRACAGMRRSSSSPVADLADEAVGRAAVRRRADTVGVDPSRRRLRHGAGGRDHAVRPDAAGRHEFRHRVPVLPGRGQRDARTGAGGRIVNVAARPALEWRAGAGMVAYTASKAAVAALTVALAEEVAKDGILVNAVAPSIMDTPANRAAMPKADHAAWPKVEEVAATILFLASPDNKVTRGAIVPVYGKS